MTFISINSDNKVNERRFICVVLMLAQHLDSTGALSPAYWAMFLFCFNVHAQATFFSGFISLSSKHWPRSLVHSQEIYMQIVYAIIAAAS